MFNSKLAPSGVATFRLLRGGSLSNVPAGRLGIFRLLYYGMPHPLLTWEVFAWRFRNIPNFFRGYWRIALARFSGVGHFYGQISLVKISAGREIDYGIASLRVVTDAGVGYIVDAFQNSVELETMKYHGFGTGTGAEAAGDSALGTELTTQYVGDVRPTGSTTEGGSANIYRSVGTLSPDSGGTIAVTEHGIFSANASGVLLDRSKFSAVNVVASADSLQTTYDLTFTSGS